MGVEPASPKLPLRIDRVFATWVFTIGAVEKGRIDSAAPSDAGGTAMSTPLGGRGPDRSRLDMALATARPSPRTGARHGGIPGLARELFPAAAWRLELDGLRAAHERRRTEREAREDARVTFSLAHPRADDILAVARSQARRLVGTAAAVARARRDQAERAAAEALARAEALAAETVAAAEARAEDIAAGSGEEIELLHERLGRLRAALHEAETKLGAFATSTRRSLAAGSGVIDLEREQQRGEIEAGVALTLAAEQEVAERAAADTVDFVVPEVAGEGVRLKGRFQVPGVTPDRIETLRDELAP